MDPSRTNVAGSNTSVDSPAGIHCANPDCRTRAGERSRGHQSCRALLCGHCCQNAARIAVEAGESRPICKVHARRVHTGHKPVIKEQHSEGSPILIATAVTSNENAGGLANPHTREPEELHELLDKRARLEQSLKRSLTLVIWYRNGYEPLRIAHEVTTFPFFQLQDFPELIAELGLQSSSYIDTINSETGQWEQHKISTVRTVEQDQRLLYRLRPSLLDGLTDCPTLEQELGLQPVPKTLLAKRQSEPFTPPSSAKQVRMLSNPNPIRAPTTASPQNTVVANWDGPIPSASTQGTPNWSLAAPISASLSGVQGSLNTAALSHRSDARSIASGPGSTKRWPSDYTVLQITEGFDAMDALIKADASIRQRTAFERVFPPCRYVKSTVGRAKLYWKRASQDIRENFLALPRDDPRGKWTHFVHLMDGRLVIEVGKGEGVVRPESGEETAEENDRLTMTNALSFPQGPVNQPQISIQSPPPMATLSSLPLTRQPPMGALLPNASPLMHHSSAPAIPMTTSFAIDRNISMNRSSSSLSGAITIPDA